MKTTTTAGKLRRWETALLMAFAGALILGIWLNGQQSALAGDVLRLHVLANSDSEADQSLKLEVRDAVLAQAEYCLEGVTSREEAEQRLTEQLRPLAEAGAEVVAEAGYSYPVTVSLEETWFPTKEYEDFALPAGTYTALRVVIGEGAGQNWWCVVFPPLCLGAVSESVESTAAMAGLSEGEISLITGEDEGYVVKFKLLELWDKLKRNFT